MRKPWILTAVVAGMTASGGPAVSAQPVAAAPKPVPLFTRPGDITHPFLPLVALKQEIFEGKEGTKKLPVERTARPDLHQRFSIGGQVVTALGVEYRAYVEGQLTGTLPRA